MGREMEGPRGPPLPGHGCGRCRHTRPVHGHISPETGDSPVNTITIGIDKGVGLYKDN